MKKFETLWQELINEFPEILDHTDEMKSFLKNFLAAKPAVKLSKNFKEELEEKIKFEIEILKKNQMLVKKSAKKNYKSWFKYAGMAFGGLVVGVMVAPFFQSTETSHLEFEPAAIQNFDAGFAPEMARMKSANHEPMAAMIQESNLSYDSYESEEFGAAMADIQIPELSDEAPELESINRFSQPFSKSLFESKKSSNEFMNIKIPVLKNEELTLPTDEEIIGCGAIIVWQELSVQKTASTLTESFNQLFAFNPETEWLRNTITNSGLNFSSVILNDGFAKIYLTGKFGIGHCAIPEIKAQIEKTAFQFDSVKKIEVYLNEEIFDWCKYEDAEPDVTGCDHSPKFWEKNKK